MMGGPPGGGGGFGMDGGMGMGMGGRMGGGMGMGSFGGGMPTGGGMPPRQQQPHQQQPHQQQPPQGHGGSGGGGMPGAPPEYANITPQQAASPFGQPGVTMQSYDAGLLNAVGNPNANSANPNDAGSLMSNGTHVMFENQHSGRLLKIQSNGDVSFDGRLMDHRETMVVVLRAPDGKHYRIGSVNFPDRWLQILPDGTINGLGTVDSPYGEFELCTPQPFHFCFVGCATHFSLAAQQNGAVQARCPSDMPAASVFKFGAPPTAGKEPYPEYVVANRAMYIAMTISSEMSMSASMKGPEVKLTGPTIEFNENGTIKSATMGKIEVKSAGSIEVDASMAASASTVALTADEICKHHGVHCAGWMPHAGDGTVPK
jgi:hypothetical protein